MTRTFGSVMIKMPTFAAFPYYPKAVALTEDQKRLQGVLYSIKNGGTLRNVHSGKTGSATEMFCKLIAKDFDATLATFLNIETALVPIPSSTAIGLRTAAEWPCRAISEQFQTRGLGFSLPAVDRVKPIATSHKVPSDQRPSVEDVADSVRIEFLSIRAAPNVTLIDDVVTSGTNGVGVMLAIRRAGYRGTVRLFAAAHTRREILAEDRFVGECTWREGSRWARRA